MFSTTSTDTEYVAGLNVGEANMPTGIKEIKELVQAVKELGDTIIDKTEDGKLSFADIMGSLPEVIKVIKEANDIEAIKAEIKDLSRDEMIELFPLLLDAGILNPIQIVKNL